MHVVHVRHQRHAGIDAGRFESRVNDCLTTDGAADHRRRHEQALLEFLYRIAVLRKVAAVVGIR